MEDRKIETTICVKMEVIYVNIPRYLSTSTHIFSHKWKLFLKITQETLVVKGENNWVIRVGGGGKFS